MDENITEKESAEPADVRQVSEGEGGKGNNKSGDATVGGRVRILVSVDVLYR